MILAARGVCKRYGAALAVDRVDLALAEGEVVSIVGRSGSGKSTLLALLGALTGPTEGSVCLDGVDLRAMSEARRAQLRARNLGFVFQFDSLLPNLRAVDNVALPALLAGTRDPDAARERALALLQSVGLAARAQVFPDALSGGEKRRVVLARALVNAPRFVLADEPTGDLDGDTEAEVVALLDRLRAEQGFGLLVVSHNLDLAARADRCYEMAAGRLLPAAIERSAPIGPATRRLRPLPPVPMVERDATMLGQPFWPAARAVLFGSAVALSLILLADSAVGRYQQMRSAERADKHAALETLALSSLRAGVRSIAARGDGRYELTLELANVAGERPLYVMAPAVRAYVQVGRQWTEVPLVALENTAVRRVVGRQAYRYAFEARRDDYARIFSRYMHVRFVNTMLVSPHATPSDELFERSDSYFVYLKPAHVDDREILAEVRFDGAPPLWIPMPPH